MKVKILSFIFLNYLIFSCHAIQAAMTVEPIVQADIGHGLKGVSDIPYGGGAGLRILSIPFSIWVKANAFDPQHVVLFPSDKNINLYRYGGALGGRVVIAPKWLMGGYVGRDSYSLLQQVSSKEKTATGSNFQKNYGQIIFGVEAITFPFEINLDVHVAQQEGDKQATGKPNPTTQFIIQDKTERDIVRKVVSYEQGSFSFKVTYHYSERIKGFGGIYWLKIPEENKFWDQIVGFGGGAQYSLNNWCNFRAKLTWDNYHSISALVGVRIAMGENHLSSKYLVAYLRQSPDYHYFMPVMTATPKKRYLRQFKLLADKLTIEDYSQPKSSKETSLMEKALRKKLGESRKFSDKSKETLETRIEETSNALIRIYNQEKKAAEIKEQKKASHNYEKGDQKETSREIEQKHADRSNWGLTTIFKSNPKTSTALTQRNSPDAMETNKSKGFTREQGVLSSLWNSGSQKPKKVDKKGDERMKRMEEVERDARKRAAEREAAKIKEQKREQADREKKEKDKRDAEQRAKERKREAAHRARQQRTVHKRIDYAYNEQAPTTSSKNDGVTESSEDEKPSASNSKASRHSHEDSLSDGDHALVVKRNDTGRLQSSEGGNETNISDHESEQETTRSKGGHRRKRRHRDGSSSYVGGPSTQSVASAESNNTSGSAKHRSGSSGLKRWAQGWG